MLYRGWICTSALVNEALGAMAVGGYSLLVLLLTLFQPKILTRSLAALLLLPVPIAAVVLLLACSPGPIKTRLIAGELFVDQVRWDAGAMGSSGTTLLLYQKPRFAPFLEHHLQRVVFNDSKCRADEAFVVLQPDKRHVLARCPWPEYSRKAGFHDFLVPLY